MDCQLIYFRPNGNPLPPEKATTVFVVIDALRATSTITTALAHGAAAVRPFATVEEARAHREAHPEVLLAGERAGSPLPGFDLGNSPREMTPETVGGRRLALTTSNGTPALRAAARSAANRGGGEADAVLAASLLNLQAVADWISARPNPDRLAVRILCAGTGRGFSLEDAITGSALVTRLEGERHPAAALWRAYGRPAASLLNVWSTTRNGRNLVKLGREDDLAFCLEENRFDTVPLLGPDGWLRRAS